MATSEPTKRKASQPPYGGWMFARDTSRQLFKLLNSGKIFPAFGLVILALMGLIAWRLPEKDLTVIVLQILGLVNSSTGLLVGIIIASNFVWAWLYWTRNRLYERELNRLIEDRHELMHMKNRVPIENHRSSKDRTPSTFIFLDSTIEQHEERT